jgi:hypothetical protein
LPCPLAPTAPSGIMPLDINAFASVRLLGFWRHSPQQWFTHVEASFHNQRIRSNLSCRALTICSPRLAKTTCALSEIYSAPTFNILQLKTV